MVLSYQQIAELEQKMGTSFFLLDVEKVRSNYKKIDDAFRSRYNRFIIGYSYKTNYLPFMCKEMDKLGAYAEVVSRLEYDLAIKIGVKSNRIIFNGPLKTEDDIHTALEQGSILNIDSLYEIDFIQNYCRKNKNKQVKVGLRVNFTISDNGVSTLQEGYGVSRFGICVANGNFEYALNKLKEYKNIKVIGLHGHFSTSERKVETYSRITKGLCKLAKEYLTETIEYIDIGGGIYGEIPSSFNINTPSFDDYAESVCSIMNTEFEEGERQPYLILEPGISMVANTFSFYAKVIEGKKVQETHFVLIDGSVHNIKPTMHKRNLPMQLIKQNYNKYQTARYNIVGYTCMEKDYLAHDIEGELPEPNDYIVFENVGAYTIVFNPPFIKERPGIIAIDQNEFYIVRRRESLREFFNEHLYVFQ
ncbi:type III PLP-dependent enzyme domain-containing protein [Neobacillus jeddahensis]|uniref:diaminopimelate decarboxylase n=1 Tax=Neobacillus jeddahensis TaxID=1461580 RepID=UPI00058AC3E4|nr:diaminopimelate decarboxylase [Neobacillus jeddahensis]